jgi:effector-binding domain-containing protein
MTAQDVTIKSVEPVRVAELSATAGSWAPEDIGPVIRPLFDELGRRLHAAGVTPCGYPIARYEQRDEDHITVYAGLPVDGGAADADRVAITELPPIERAATMLHHGSMDGVVASYEALALWIEDNGLRSVGLSREVTLQCPADPDGWVTELQMVVADQP